MLRNAHSNNFDFLRLLAAYMVLFSHQFAVTGQAEPDISFQKLGRIGVLIFFSISGYLVAQSWKRDPVALRFLARRILRIWPGLIVVVLISALLLGPIVSTLSVKDYFLSSQTWDYLRILQTLTTRMPLPGVFTDNPKLNVNVSLWTLQYEFRWYLVLLVLGLIGLLRYRSLLLIGFIAFAVFVFAIHDPQHHYHRSPNLPLGAFFLYGVCLNYFRDFWSARPKLILSVLGLMSAILIAFDYQYAALFLVLPALVVFFGSASTPFICRAGRFGDFSYGIYIYGYPVQQTVIMLTGNHLSMWVTLAISTSITVTLAFLSWHLIERPALRLKHYFQRENGSLHVAEATNQPQPT